MSKAKRQVQQNWLLLTGSQWARKMSTKKAWGSKWLSEGTTFMNESSQRSVIHHVTWSFLTNCIIYLYKRIQAHCDACLFSLQKGHTSNIFQYPPVLQLMPLLPGTLQATVLQYHPSPPCPRLALAHWPEQGGPPSNRSSNTPGTCAYCSWTVMKTNKQCIRIACKAVSLNH